MKRILVIIVLFMSLISVSAETRRFKVELFNAKVVDSDWSGWKSSNVILKWDNMENKIVIYSTEIQYINYTDFEIRRVNESTVLYSTFKDRYKRLSVLLITIYDNGDIYLAIDYQDAQLVYKIVDIKED